MSKIKIIRTILSGCIFIIMSAILKQKQGCARNPPNSAKSFDLLHCVKMRLVLSANLNAGLQCKINSANQRVVECIIDVLFISCYIPCYGYIMKNHTCWYKLKSPWCIIGSIYLLHILNAKYSPCWVNRSEYSLFFSWNGVEFQHLIWKI